MELEANLIKDENMQLFNNVYLNNIEKVDDIVTTHFSNCDLNIKKIVNNAKEFLKSKYLKSISDFEVGMNEIIKEKENLDKENPLEIKRLYSKINYLISSIEDQNSIDKYFELYISVVIKKLNTLQMRILLNDSLEFSFDNKNYKPGWNGSSDPIAAYQNKDSKVCLFKSNQSFIGEFMCRVKVVLIDETCVNENWSHTFGLSENNNYKDDNYSLNSSLFFSNGCRSYNKGKCEVREKHPSIKIWKNDDILEISRDHNDIIYFQQNNEGKIRTGINNKEVYIVIGFNTNVTNALFEMIEIGSYFNEVK